MLLRRDGFVRWNPNNHCKDDDLFEKDCFLMSNTDKVVVQFYEMRLRVASPDININKWGGGMKDGDRGTAK